MTPQGVQTWTRAFRDVFILGLGGFLLIYETLATGGNPNALLVGAGLTLVGVPPLLRLDEFLGRKNGE